MKRASCGLDINSPFEICKILKSASDYGFEFVCIPLVHPRFKREFIAKWQDRSGPFTRPDLVLKSNEWNSLIAGKVSPYLNLDSMFLNGQFKFALEQELNYGSHLDVPAVIIPIRNSKCFNLARIINSNLSGLKTFQVWLEIPLVSHSTNASTWRSDLNEGQEENTWEWWNSFYTLCNSDKKLGVALEITRNIPDEEELHRWAGEPIKCLIISTSTFLTNKKGYPVLSRPIQSFIKSLVPIDIQVIIKGNNHHSSFDCYQKYIDHLWQEASVQQNPKITEDNSPDKNSIDYPLQPFGDNMSRCYEISEKDWNKYRQYAKAIHQAILDQVMKMENSTKVLKIMVVGGGKGSLVLASYAAAAKSNQKFKIFAVEKNPNAVVALEAYKEEFWKDTVEIICENIKNLKFPQIIDIVVTESLGSFGDNELSPEISDEAQKFLKRGGASIPERYTSYICPVQGSKVHSDLKSNRNCSDYEIPYVIMQKHKRNISSMKPLFSFHHPNYSEHIDNSRYKNLVFNIEENCVLHGFTGFFDVVLYKDVKLSFVPNSHNPEFDRWNPIFFPVMDPVHLKPGDELSVHFWRLVGNSRVWYEWTITKPIPLPLHNPNGRSSHINLE